MSYFKITALRILQWLIIGMIGVLLLGIGFHRVSGLSFETIYQNIKTANVSETANILSSQKAIEDTPVQTEKIPVEKIEVNEIVEVEELEKVIQCESSDLLEEYNYEFIGFNSDQTKMKPGSKATISVYLKNTGTQPWYGVETDCQRQIYLGTEQNQDRASQFWMEGDESNWLQDEYHNRISFHDDEVLPEEIAVFEFSTILPEKSGIYREYFSPVFPGFAWLNGQFYLDLEVGKIKDEDYEKLAIANLSSSTADMQEDANIEVDLSTQTMYLRYGETRFRSLQVSSGNPRTGHTTPSDTWYVYNKQEKRVGSAAPHYVMENWVGLSRPRIGFQGYGLHALPYLVDRNGNEYWNEKDEPNMHLGSPVSHGCVRMEPETDKIVWDFAEVGMRVWTHN